MGLNRLGRALPPAIVALLALTLVAAAPSVRPWGFDLAGMDRSRQARYDVNTTSDDMQPVDGDGRL